MSLIHHRDKIQKFENSQILEGVSTQKQSSSLVAYENSTFRNLALAVSVAFMA